MQALIPKSVVEIIAEYMIINKTLPNKREIFNRAAHLMDVVGLARRYATAYPHEFGRWSSSTYRHCPRLIRQSEISSSAMSQFLH